MAGQLSQRCGGGFIHTCM